MRIAPMPCPPDVDPVAFAEARAEYYADWRQRMKYALRLAGEAIEPYVAQMPNREYDIDEELAAWRFAA